jgi:antitoxin (DNA-binding transcriptional repressor) of toxin-antitoxin stability system
MTRIMAIVTISKSKLKSQMLEIFRDLEKGGGEVVVTDRGRPVLRITPFREQRSVADIFADVQGSLVFHEDPDAPVEAEWELD